MNGSPHSRLHCGHICGLLLCQALSNFMNLPNLKEFETFLHEFSGSGSLDIAIQRFFDPYVAYTGEAGKSWDVGLRGVRAC